MPAGVLLVADDLSGAADAAVPFALRGARTLVRLEPGAVTAEPGSVTVVDTDTRNRAPGAARRAVAGVLRQHPSLRTRGTLLIKKVDSTLRGPLAAELEAVLEHAGGPVLLAPAFPATGRTTLGGVQLVHGTPLHHSSAWASEPGTAPDSIAAALRPLPCEHLGIQEVRGDAARLRARIADAAGRRLVLVCDAETDDDLDRLAAAGMAARAGPAAAGLAWAGTGGLTAALARRLHGHAGQHTRRPGAGGPVGRPPGTALAVVGSATELARRQAAELARHGARPLVLPAGQVLAAGDAELGEMAAAARFAVAQGDTVLSLEGAAGPAPAGRVAAGQTRRPGAARPALPELCARLARVARDALGLADLVVLTGGETARAALRELGVGTLRVLGEPEPGVVLSQALPGDPRRWTGGPRYVMTKAGGFGDAGTLVRALDACRAERTPL